MEDYLSTILLFIVLLIFSGIFSASETALTGANRIRLKNQSEQGDKRAKTALNLIENYSTSINALLIGNNIVNTLSASIATVMCTKLFSSGGVGIATLGVTVLVIIFGEVIPKSFANLKSEMIIKTVSTPLLVLKTILAPISFLLESLKKLVLRPSFEGAVPSVTEDELKVLLEEIEDEGVIKEEQGELLQSALEFSDILVDEILTPRVDIVAISQDASVEEIKECFITNNFSRLPVYQKTVDNIKGVINQKDFFKALVTGSPCDIEHVIKPCLYVPPKKHISELMSELQRKKVHVAIVSDEYGGTQGLITLEDILEELVGDIWDEHDEVTTLIDKLEDGWYEISGEIDVEDLFENLLPGIRVPDLDVSSVAGLALEELGHIPKAEESFETDHFTFIIKQVEDQRIIKLHVRVR